MFDLDFSDEKNRKKKKKKKTKRNTAEQSEERINEVTDLLSTEENSEESKLPKPIIPTSAVMRPYSTSVFSNQSPAYSSPGDYDENHHGQLGQGKQLN